jgi:TRAP-type C4-dicarboxylate transport system permease small subunit
MPERKGPGAVTLLRLLLASERWLAVTAFIVLVAVVFADVLSRELSGGGLYWASRVGVWANVVVVMAGFGLATADGAHLRPRFADNWLPESWLPAVLTLQHICQALFYVVLGLLAGRVVFGSWQLGEVSVDLFIPVWPIQLFLPLAFSIAAVRHLLYVIYPHLRPVDINVMNLADEPEK